jgi:rare lipoprotein A
MVRAGGRVFGPRQGHVSWAVLVAVGLTGCTDIAREASRGGSLLELATPATSRTVERDVPAPQVFQVTETGLWDGRPSLGGVWVAHPTARDPERVLIRNTVTGAEVVGALFRRERENPGPRFQISSEAAVALGILAGQPVALQVTALRLERIEVAPPPPVPTAAPSAATPTPEAPAEGAIAAAPVPDAEAAPRRTLADLFRRSAPAPEPDVPVPAAAAAPDAPAVPSGAPFDTVTITSVDSEPAEPRRSLFDLFRRRDGAPAGQPPIAETALAPVAPVASPAAQPTLVPASAAPLAATALLAPAGDAAIRPARFEEPGVLAPDGTAAVPQPEGRGLMDLFRRRPPEVAPPAPDTNLIPFPAAPQAVAAPPPASPAAAAAAPARASGRSFVQVGIFAVEANAERTRAQMRAAGLPAEIRPGQSGERSFWRVIVGPATDAEGQADLIRRARALGFADAYAVAG